MNKQNLDTATYIVHLFLRDGQTMSTKPFTLDGDPILLRQAYEHDASKEGGFMELEPTVSVLRSEIVGISVKEVEYG